MARDVFGTAAKFDRHKIIEQGVLGSQQKAKRNALVEGAIAQSKRDPAARWTLRK